MADLNVLNFLIGYLGECGRNGGRPLAGRREDAFTLWQPAPKTCCQGTATAIRIKHPPISSGATSGANTGKLAGHAPAPQPADAYAQNGPFCADFGSVPITMLAVQF
jgi:hypothetical protein